MHKYAVALMALTGVMGLLLNTYFLVRRRDVYRAGAVLSSIALFGTMALVSLTPDGTARMIGWIILSFVAVAATYVWIVFGYHSHGGNGSA